MDTHVHFPSTFVVSLAKTSLNLQGHNPCNCHTSSVREHLSMLDSSMSKYNEALQQHLTRYKQDRLGIREDGNYKGKPYGHILPQALRYLNILEPIRHELQRYLQDHPQVKLHQFFHHLNSSQAFSFKRIRLVSLQRV